MRNFSRKSIECYRFVICILLTVGICVLTGCKTGNIGNTENDTNAWPPVDFNSIGDVVFSESFELVNYKEWVHLENEPDFNEIACISSGERDGMFFSFGAELTEEGIYPYEKPGRYYLEIYNVENDIITKNIITPNDFEIEAGVGYFVGFDMAGDGKYLFRWAGYLYDGEVYTQNRDLLIISDLHGNNSYIDVLDFFADKKVESYRSEILPLRPRSTCKLGPENTVWVKSFDDSNEQIIIVFDANKNALIENRYDSQQVCFNPLFCKNECAILPVYSTSKSEYEFYLINQGLSNQRVLGSLSDKKLSISDFYYWDGDNIYFQAMSPDLKTGAGIVKWNTASGELIWIMSFSVSNLSSYDVNVSFASDGSGAVFLHKEDMGKTKDWIASLSANDGNSVQSGSTIRVADMVGDNERLKQCVSYSSMESPFLTYSYEKVTSGDETKVFLEMINGAGPDILYVSQDDFVSLWNKGLLLDLNSVISPSTLDTILPGAKQIGTVGDAVYGLPIGVHIEAMALGSDLGISRWDLDAIIDLMKAKQIKPTVYSPCVFNGYLSSQLSEQIILKRSLNDSFLINWENNKCNFDDGRFISFLKLMSADYSREMVSDDISDHLIWGYISNYLDAFKLLSLVDSSNGRFLKADDAEAVGYIITEGGIVVVNSNIENVENARWFLNNLYSKDIQKSLSSGNLGVLKLDRSDYATEDVNGETKYFGVIEEKKLKKDENGLDFIDKLAIFMNNCIAQPSVPGKILTILNEELTIMNEQGRSIEETVHIINSRVQLYLNEKSN